VDEKNVYVQPVPVDDEDDASNQLPLVVPDDKYFLMCMTDIRVGVIKGG
jgi:hypothetical protein